MITDGLNPLAAVAFLGTALGALALTALYVYARLTGRPSWGRWALRLGGVGAGAYLLLYVVASVTSRDVVLAPGEEKHICEVDCHLAYSVTGVKTEPASTATVRHIVTVKVRFDQETISTRRALDRELSPNSRYVALVDAQGRRYPIRTDGFQRRLVPGQGYTTDLVFEVPVGARDLRLILRSNDVPTRFIVGHENSIGHGGVTFALEGTT